MNKARLDGSEVIDIVSDGGAKVHFYRAIEAHGDRWIVKGDYVVAERAENIEIRLWVADGSDLSLAGISLTPRVFEAVDEEQFLMELMT